MLLQDLVYCPPQCRNAVRLCSWGIVKGLHTRLKSAQIPISFQFWESFLSFFLDAGADDKRSDAPGSEIEITVSCLTA